MSPWYRVRSLVTEHVIRIYSVYPWPVLRRIAGVWFICQILFNFLRRVWMIVPFCFNHLWLPCSLPHWAIANCESPQFMRLSTFLVGLGNWWFFHIVFYRVLFSIVSVFVPDLITRDPLNSWHTLCPTTCCVGWGIGCPSGQMVQHESKWWDSIDMKSSRWKRRKSDQTFYADVVRGTNILCLVYLIMEIFKLYVYIYNALYMFVCLFAFI